MLLVLGGNAAPSKADVTTALAAVGVDVSFSFYLLSLFEIVADLRDAPRYISEEWARALETQTAAQSIVVFIVQLTYSRLL